ncbi:hypothetical protein SCALM49S_03160 [Streptomyces californicus]
MEPWDATWGQRYAVVLDPDGCGVSLFAPLLLGCRSGRPWPGPRLRGRKSQLATPGPLRRLRDARRSSSPVLKRPEGR